MISVLHSSAWYPPAHVGGTEVYVTGLVRELRAHGIISRVIAPLGLEQADGYEFEGTRVRTYPVSARHSRAELRGETQLHSLSRFREILREEKPDIYHQHSWTLGLGASHLRVAHELGLRTILTVHVPNTICLRGTMMRFGQSACDGHIDEVKCAECWSHGRGAPKLLAHALARVPSTLGAALQRAGIDGRAAMALSAQHLVGQRRAEFASMIDNADRVVAVCQWLYDALERNGVPRKKLVLSRQGVDPQFAASVQAAVRVRTSAKNAFRLVYLGRWHPVKGVHLLVEAVRRIPKKVSLELVVYGIGEGPEKRAYEAKLKRLAKGDARIQFCPAIPRERLAETLLRADAVAVPSTWMETGPLVVWEAKSAGVPVIGSRLGGIAELVREPDDGVLVDPGSVQAWAEAITTMALSHIARRPDGARNSIRTMQDAAGEMAALYRLLC